jgi:hypothetical protein
VSDEQSGAAPYRVTFKGQGQTDPWLTVEGSSVSDFVFRLGELTDDQYDEEGAPLSVLALAARVAAEWVTALNEQPGISYQRDTRAAQPVAQPAAERPLSAEYQQSGSPSAGQNRPALSTSLELESDGNYWIAVPYVKDAKRRARMRDKAKELKARYAPEEAPPEIPRNKNDVPERPWRVHLQYVSDENVAELLRLHETAFQEIA